MERKTDVRGKEREGDNWPTGSHQAAHAVGCFGVCPFGKFGVNTGNMLTVDLQHFHCLNDGN